MLIVAFSLVLLLGDTSPVVFLLVITAISGIPQGLNNPANQNALYYQAAQEQLASLALILFGKSISCFFAQGVTGS